MSAFIVRHSTIDSIINYLNYCYITDKEIKRLINLGGYKFPLFKRELGQAMISLNTEAVNFRYEEKIDLGFYEPVNGIACTDLVALKLIKCWIYQCSEGKQFEDTQLYQIFKEIEYHILNKIVTSSKAYENAPWE